MSVLDVFSPSAFDVIALTDAVNRIAGNPYRLYRMGLLTKKPIATTTAMIEELNGKLSLVPTTVRGSQPTPHGTTERKAKAISVSHVAKYATVLADKVQGVRAFGSESNTESVDEEIAEAQAEMKNDILFTFEHMLSGMIKGIVYDADGSTALLNLFTFFGVAAPGDVDFVLGTSTTNVGQKVLDITRSIEDACGGMPLQGIHCLCGHEFFDKMTAHAEVKTAYDLSNERSFFRDDQRKGFVYKGVTFEEYRVQAAGRPFIAKGDARFFPVGPGLYTHVMAPADYVEAVNSNGREFYSKTAVMKFDKGVEVEVQSNPLFYCTVPKALIRGYSSN